MQEGGGVSPRWWWWCVGWDVVQHAGEKAQGCVPIGWRAWRGNWGAWWVLATLAVPAGSVVLSHSSREGGGAAAANCCLLPEMPVLRGLAWGLFIARGRVAAGMAPCWVQGLPLGSGVLAFFLVSNGFELCAWCSGSRLCL